MNKIKLIQCLQILNENMPFSVTLIKFGYSNMFAVYYEDPFETTEVKLLNIYEIIKEYHLTGEQSEEVRKWAGLL